MYELLLNKFAGEPPIADHYFGVSTSELVALLSEAKLGIFSDDMLSFREQVQEGKDLEDVARNITNQTKLTFTDAMRCVEAVRLQQPS